MVNSVVLEGNMETTTNEKKVCENCHFIRRPFGRSLNYVTFNVIFNSISDKDVYPIKVTRAGQNA